MLGEFFFYSALDPQGIAVGGILEILENTNVNISVFGLLCNYSLPSYCQAACSSGDSVCKITCVDELHVL